MELMSQPLPRLGFLGVSASGCCGLAELSSGDTAEDVIRRADDALYDAKVKRNQVCICRKPFLGGFFKAASSLGPIGPLPGRSSPRVGSRRQTSMISTFCRALHLVS